MMDTLRRNIEGRAVPIIGDEIDTDQIIPARFLKEITFDNMGHYLFYDQRFNTDKTPKVHILNDTQFWGAKIMISGRNFGCGSSREHAPQAIMRFGIQAIIAESFSEIFSGNCTAIGIPTLRVSAEGIFQLQKSVLENPAQIITLNLAAKTITYSEGEIFFDMPESHRQSFLMGTWETGTLLAQNGDQIQKTAQALPYLNNFGEY